MKAAIIPAKLRPTQAALLLGVSKSALLRWERDLPGFPAPSRPTSRVTLYDREKLLAFVERSTVTQPAATIPDATRRGG